MIEILWDACVSTFKFLLRGRAPNRKVWFKREREREVVVVVVAALSSCRFKERGREVTRSAVERSGEGETSSTRANFSTNLANLFHGRIRHADPWELSRSFQIRIDRLSHRPMFRVHRCFSVRSYCSTNRPRHGSNRSVVKASKSLNVVRLSHSWS